MFQNTKAAKHRHCADSVGSSSLPISKKSGTKNFQRQSGYLPVLRVKWSIAISSGRIIPCVPDQTVK